jgi:plastocyanin
MRRLLVLLMLVAGLAGAGAVLPGAAADGAARRSFPARMLVYAQEWSLQPSRATLPAGRVTVQLWNRGEDAHDLRVRRIGAHGALVGRTQGVALTQSGALHQATWTLGPGRYEMYCSLPGHAMRGMRVRIVIRAAASHS